MSASDEAHLEANLEAASIEPTGEEIARIGAIDRQEELSLDCGPCRVLPSVWSRVGF